MDYIIAVLQTRTQTMAFFQYIKRFGVACMIIDTPKTISKSCGISVRFPESKFNLVKSICNQNYSYVKFYKFQKNNFGKIGLIVVN